MSLFKKTGDFQLRLNVSPPDAGEDITTVPEIFDHIERATTLTATSDLQPTAFVVSDTEPGPDETDRPWLRFDSEGRFFGVQHYNTLAGAWVRAGVPGELLTIQRTEETVELDQKAKGLWGSWDIALDLYETAGTDFEDWHPHDTGEIGFPFFKGVPGSFEVYTVRRL